MGTFRKRPIRYPLFVLSIFGIVTFVLLCIWNIGIGLGYGIGFALLMVYTWKVEKIAFEETEKHIESISFRMKKVGEEALLEMPIGILLVNEQYEIEWSNPYMQGILNMESLVGEGIVNISDDIYVLMKTEETNEATITLRDRKYRVYYKKRNDYYTSLILLSRLLLRSNTLQIVQLSLFYLLIIMMKSHKPWMTSRVV